MGEVGRWVCGRRRSNHVDITKMHRAARGAPHSRRADRHAGGTGRRGGGARAHLVALEMAQAASFLMSNSAVASRWMRGGMMPASTTVCRQEGDGGMLCCGWGML